MLNWLPSLAAIAVLMLPSLAAAQSGRTIFCCEDEQAQAMCGDVLPSACYGRAYREISPRGSVIRHVAAPLTPAEAAKLEAENRKRAREEAVLRQQRRFDLALLDTYQSLDDIDAREARALADAERSIAGVRERRAELLAERRALVEVIAGYKEGEEVPEAVLRSLTAVNTEMSSYERVVTAKEVEKEAIVARYAADRRRYAELIAGGAVRRPR